MICVVFFGLIIFKLRRVFFNACGYTAAAVENKHCGSVHYITIGDSMLRTVASATGLWDAESIILLEWTTCLYTSFYGFICVYVQVIPAYPPGGDTSAGSLGNGHATSVVDFC